MRVIFVSDEEAGEAALRCGFTTGVTPHHSDIVANEIAPWHAIVVRVEGGWKFFESAQDYDTWRKQT